MAEDPRVPQQEPPVDAAARRSSRRGWRSYVFNRVKAGGAVPVRFSLGGDQGLDIFAADFPKSQPVSCTTAAISDPIEETVTASNSSLSYDPASDTYTYVWKTNKAWAGKCRVLTVQLDDGTPHLAYFRFK